jgi:Heavy metal binding domain
VLLAAAACAVVAGVLSSRRTDRAAAVDAGARYTCPMHPEVVSRHAGNCPICGMALEPMSEGRDGPPGHGARRAAPLSQDRDDGVMTPHASLTLAQSVELPRYETDWVRRRILGQEHYAPAWRESDTVVVALLYQDEVASLGPGERARFVPSGAPNTDVDVERTSDPPGSWDRTLSQVRFRIDAGGAVAPAHAAPPVEPGAVGWVKLNPRPREVLVVTDKAVLESSEGAYVLTLSRDRGSFARRPIEIGKTVKGWTVVVSGLSVRDVVASTNTFFLDAERRLHAERRASDRALP